MSTPFIGITMFGRNEKKHFSVPAQYGECVRRAGGIPFCIPPGEERIESLLDHLDGLILTGGGDLDPAHYNGKMHTSIYSVDRERDFSELNLLEYALKIQLPVLGICRGLQVMNIMLGGTLIEHLPDIVGEQILHRTPGIEPIPHKVSVLPDSMLAQILSETRFTVSSWHHQSILDIGSPLKVVAQADDGVIEAAEIPGDSWVMGVQWHPELSAETDGLHQKLFDSLIKKAGMDKN